MSNIPADFLNIHVWEISEDIVASYEFVMVTAAHTTVDYEMIQRSAKAIFDTKNVMKNLENRENIEVL